MSKSKKSIIGQELAEIPLEAAVVESMTGNGIGLAKGKICAGGVNITVMFQLSDPSETEMPLLEDYFHSLNIQLAKQQASPNNGCGA